MIPVLLPQKGLSSVFLPLMWLYSWVSLFGARPLSPSTLKIAFDFNKLYVDRHFHEHLDRLLHSINYTPKVLSQINSKQIITIAEEAEITVSSNMLIYMSKQRLSRCSVRHVPAGSDRTQTLHIHDARLGIGNLGTKLLFINFR